MFKDGLASSSVYNFSNWYYDMTAEHELTRLEIYIVCDFVADVVENIGLKVEFQSTCVDAIKRKNLQDTDRCKTLDSIKTHLYIEFI